MAASVSSHDLLPPSLFSMLLAGTSLELFLSNGPSASGLSGLSNSGWVSFIIQILVEEFDVEDVETILSF